MLVGAILLLLGTSLGEPATKTEVKYDGPDKITVVQETDDRLLPGVVQPPFAPNLFHHGANFFFNSQVVVPAGAIPKINSEIVIPPLNDCNITVLTPEVASVTLIEKEPIVEAVISEDIPEPPSIAIREVETQKIVEPIPEVQVEIQPLPVIPAGPELPELIDIPTLPLPITVQEQPNAVICENVESNKIIFDGPMVVEEPVQPIMPEINIHITDLPPPPELPPIVFSEIPRPVVIEESKRVVLIPSAPQLTAFYPPSVYFSQGQLIPTDCAQNIILERVLPNIAFDYGRTLELISIPAAKRPPVVQTLIYP